MRAGLTTSVLFHATVLGWAIFRLSAPDSFQVADTEALPVELVSAAELTQVQKGAKDAKKDGPATPLPTEKPPVDKQAENLGDKERDQKAPETKDQKAAEVDQTELPKPSEAPVPEPTPKPEPPQEAKPEPKPAPEPTTEMASLPQPKQEVAPDPTDQPPAEPEPVPAEEPKKVLTPDAVPLPSRRPETPKAQAPKTNERKQTKPQEQAKATPKTPDDSKAIEDEVAALLNRETASGGGAKRSTEQASFGAKKTTAGVELTQSEMDALRSQIQQCWSPPAALGASDLKVSVRFSLDSSGMLEGRPSVTKSSGNRAADDSAVRAIQRCEQQNQGYKLPAEKYDAWKDIVVNFDPSEMFR